MRCLVLTIVFVLSIYPRLSADAFALLGKDFPFKSNGSKLESGGWELTGNDYMGTYLTLAKPGRVEFVVKASGRGGIMHLHVGDKRFAQVVNESNSRDFRFKCDLPAGVHSVRIEMNRSPMRNDIASLKVGFLSVSGDGASLAGSDPNDDLVLKAADTYIENYRRGPVELTLTDGKGKPLLAGTDVHVKLRKHAFDFGTAVYGTNAQNGDWLRDNPAPGSDAFKYQRFLNTHFNMIVPENAGKWGSCEAERDKETMGLVDSMLAYAASNGLRARMHCVLWGQSLPKWAETMLDTAIKGPTQQERDAAKKELRGQITERINTLVRDRAGKYVQVDGINESAHQDGFLNAYGNDGIAGIYDEIIKASAGRARVYFNEYNLFQWGQQFGYKDDYANWYKDHIEKIGVSQANRQRIGIGMQYYTSAEPDAIKYSPHSPVRIAKVLQNLTIFELPMSLTEFGVGSAGVQFAPKYLSDTMRLVFGSDQTTSFLMWGFQRPHMWTPGSALVDDNWNLTECGKTYEQLLGIHDWGIAGLPMWTTDLTLKTDRKGRVSFKAFHGDYDVTVDGRSRSLTVVKGRGSYGL